MSQSGSTEFSAEEPEFQTESSLLSTFRELRRSPTALGGLAIIGLLVGMAIFSTVDLVLLDKQLITALIADPHATDTTAIYEPPSAEHPMGTDQFGRDILARIIYGSRVALAIGIIAVGIGFSGGVIFGSIAAYEGGYVDDLIMRFLETLYSIPGLVLALTFAAIFGSSIFVLFFAFGIIGIPGYARVMRSEVLSIREEEYVDAARAAGLPRRTILFREIVPNGIAAVVVQATLSMGGVIIGAAALSFLGFGVQPPTADWGRMLNTAQEALFIAPWVAAFPGLMIFFTVMGFNMLGDGLRDAMDPRVDLRSPDMDRLEEAAVGTGPDRHGPTDLPEDEPAAADGGERR